METTVHEPPATETLATVPLEGELTGNEVIGAERGEGKQLLAFYDGLRDRLVASAERRAGRRGATAADLLLTVPDIFLLLARLAVDREVPAAKRALMTAALVYFVAPVDLMPEAFVGVNGFLDDVLLATAVICEAFGADLERHASRHWAGSSDLLSALNEVTGRASRLLGPRLTGRIRRLLDR